MCLAVPGQVLTIDYSEPSFPCARVSFSGVVKNVNLAYVPDVTVNDYVLVHVGFAIAKINETEAQRVFEYLQEIDAVNDEIY